MAEQDYFVKGRHDEHGKSNDNEDIALRDIVDDASTLVKEQRARSCQVTRNTPLYGSESRVNKESRPAHHIGCFQQRVR